MPYHLNGCDKILLLGEGNFSFSENLIKNAVSEGLKDFSKVYASCFESRSESFLSSETEALLVDKGVNVLFSVDATRLDALHSTLGCDYEKIVFNFPHVGGKMKIQLNRDLLKSFFSCCPHILRDDGSVVVALCAGQGGTAWDTKLRCYEDTWKIVEMAAFGSFVLNDIVPWPSHEFPSYSPTGYRGTKKRFHTEKALVHIFKKGRSIRYPHIPALLHPHTITIGQTEYRVPFVIKETIRNSPLLRLDSPQYALVELLQSVAQEIGLQMNFELPLFTCDNELRRSLSAVVPSGVKSILCAGLVFPLSTSTPSTPAKIEVLLIHDRAQSVIREFMSCVSSLSQVTPIEPHKFWVMRDKTNSLDVCALCSALFNLSPWELWSPNLTWDRKSTVNRYLLTPHHFTFHISFSIRNPFPHSKFHRIVQSLPYIHEVRYVTEFDLSESETSYTYSITYLSADPPLHRSMVIDYQNKVVAKALIFHLAANIR